MHAEQGEASRRARLFFLSLVSLYLEILVIRWVEGEIRIFAYFKNLALIAAFLGLGLGYVARKPRLSLRWCAGAVFLLAFLLHPNISVGSIAFRRISDYLAFDDRHIWYLTPVGALLVAEGFAMLAVLFLVEVFIFVPLGQALADEFRASRRRVLDYSINVGASLVGIALFALLSVLAAPPWTWFAGAAVFLLPLVSWRDWKETLSVAVCMALAVLLVASYNPPSPAQVFWSPYQKINLDCSRYRFSPKEPPLPFCHLLVNGVHHQHILDLSDATLRARPSLFSPALARYGTYDLPFRFAPHPADVLIVGAGTGNDVAAALRAGAQSVDAVEIDPTIAKTGRRLHPEKPYDSDRVHFHVDDARAFFRRTNRSFDVVTFQTLDSHTLTSNFTNVNLDSYVYTEESFQEMRRLLKPTGIAFLTFYAERPFIAARIHGLLTKVFGEPPLVFRSAPEWFRGNSGIVFVAGDVAAARATASADPILREWVERDAHLSSDWRSLRVDLTTDDWPYLYLENRGIPTLWIILTATIAVLATTVVLAFLIAGRSRSGDSGETAPSRNLLRVDFHFFFLGAAFLLFETHSITKASLLFGSTWIVSSVTIAALLVLILLANAISTRLGERGFHLAYLGLFLTLGLNYAIPRRDWFLGLSGGMGPPVAALVFTIPALFAGIIFAMSFRRAGDLSGALGSNLLGAVPGALLESASFAVGIRATILLALALYLASYAAWAMGGRERDARLASSDGAP